MKLNKTNLQDVVTSTLIAETPAYALIEDWELAQANSGKQMLKLTLRLAAGQDTVAEDDHSKPVPSEKVLLWENILLEPTGGLTQDMIDAKLKRLAEALGHEEEADLTTDMLEEAKLNEVPLKVLVKVRAGKDGREARNEVAKFYKAS